MKLRKMLFITLAFVALGSCKKIEEKFDGMLINPNFPDPAAADADLFLTQAQLSFAGFFDDASSFGMELTRQIHFSGPTYASGFTPESFNGIWLTAYTGVIKQIDALIPIAEQQKKFVNVGMAKILKAYTLMTLVDMFGDIPSTEANLGSANTNPKIDKGIDVYAKAIMLLDEAIADLAKTPGSFPGVQDLFYGASSAVGARRWVTLAKTLKFRAFVTTRLVDPTAKSKIDALLLEDDLINVPAQDFEFKYSTRLAAPNTRHPRYNTNYVATGAVNYMANHFMWTLVQEKGGSVAAGTVDPRSRYYFYRQRSNYAEVTQITKFCVISPRPAHYPAGMPFCLLTAGYWGRDHADNSGIPPDGPLRTTVGIYPFGGDFDASQGTSVLLNRGGHGAGIQPIWQSAYTQFLKAEVALTVTPNPLRARSMLESGLRQSFAKVIGYPATIAFTVPDAFVPSAARIDDWVLNRVLPLYDAAADKMEVIMKEYYIALWGNGVDAYNNYRRTGKPGNMQWALLPFPGDFNRSQFYPSNHVNLNVNAKQKPGVAVQVFWDNNPAGFIK